MQTTPHFKFFPKARLILIVLIGVLPFSQAISQQEASFLEKLSPVLWAEAGRRPPSDPSLFLLSVSDTARFSRFLEHSPAIRLRYFYAPAGVYLLQTRWGVLIDTILPREEVLFADEQRTPRQEVAVSNLDLGTNGAGLLFQRYPQYNGSQLTVSVKEDSPDSADIDFRGRYIMTPFASPVRSSHASNMATIIGGAGNSYYEGRGVVPGVRISAAGFSTLLPEPDASYQQYNISVQNHSYGTGIENFYGADAMAYDASTGIRPHLLHVFSAGNAGTQTSTMGPYAGVTGFANLTGSFKMAKNILTVGHTDSFQQVLPASSRGPAYDGRIKPELVAFGEDGSSGAAAIVSGISLALQEAYLQLNGNLPPAALVKGLILNSAADTGPPGPDFHSGFGAANGYRAMQTLIEGRFILGEVAEGNTNSYPLYVPPGIKRLKLMLLWNDPPASANAPKALLHDLDLELNLPAAGTSWLPWVLNHSADPDSLVALPQRKKDSLNNIEQVTLDSPVEGNYEIRVNGFDINSGGPQSYAIVYQLDTADRFHWYSPATADAVFAGGAHIARWESQYGSVTGQLSFTINEGASWVPISNDVNLEAGYLRWNTPDTFVQARLRMTIGAQQYDSENFVISRRIPVSVGFDCPDSFLIYWPQVRGVQQYRVYELGERYMEPLAVTNDTSIILQKAGHPSLHYAVAPLLGNTEGIRSYGFNYTIQGTGCYVRSFFGSLAGNEAILDLELGTLYQVQTIVLERWEGGIFVDIAAISPLAGNSIRFRDPQPARGINTYRVRIVLAGGGIVYSEQVQVYYFGSASYILFPNPAPRNGQVNVLVADVNEESILQVWNTMGQKLKEVILDDVLVPVSLHSLQAGLYFFRFIGAGGKTEVHRLVVH